MILLDTNAVYWGMTGDDRLGSGARDLLSGEPQRYVSSITHVELVIKQMVGKLHLPGDLAERLVGIGLQGLPYTEKHAVGLRTFPSLARHDPFDRMLLAQAHVEGMSFLTGDRALLSLDQPWIIDATL